MKIIYAQEKLNIKEKSIFLAGPTPRKKEIKSWRPKFIKLFNKYNFGGTLLIPELRNTFSDTFVYKKQVDWELKAMKKVDIILFWIPRELKNMPGFTTNIEFGYWIAKNSKKIEIGIPENAENCNYIKYICDINNKKVFNNKKNLIKYII